MNRTSVVILNFNGARLLRKFLPSVIRHSTDAEIVVADNGSTDDSLAILKDEFPTVRRIELPNNYGFCGGYNKALQQIDSDFFVLLNSDVEVTPGWLTPLQKLMTNNPDVAAIQPKILSFHNRDTFEYAGAGGGFIDALGYPFCRGRIFDHLERDHGQYDDEREVFWASGACMMIRAEAFNRFGGFDEQFFAHMEEVDLCWKLQRAGMRVYYCGKSTVYHLGAGTLGYGNPRKTRLNFRNGLSLIMKHYGSAESVVKIPLRIALDWLAALMFLLKGQVSSAGSIFQAHADVFSSLKSVWIKRKELRKDYPTYPRKNIYRGLIVFAYYLRGKTNISV